jgi:hypothetical protein
MLSQSGRQHRVRLWLRSQCPGTWPRSRPASPGCAAGSRLCLGSWQTLPAGGRRRSVSHSRRAAGALGGASRQRAGHRAGAEGRLRSPGGEERDEAAGLRIWDGNGAVWLYAACDSTPTYGLLLERCVPGTPLAGCRPSRSRMWWWPGCCTGCGRSRTRRAPSGRWHICARRGPMSSRWSMRPPVPRTGSIRGWSRRGSRCSARCPRAGRQVLLYTDLQPRAAEPQALAQLTGSPSRHVRHDAGSVLPCPAGPRFPPPCPRPIVDLDPAEATMISRSESVCWLSGARDQG